MYLKSLEMQGFKSFPDKICLDFGKGITAVVGPNGSGKSNIGDAVRWVLGEQSSKTLRGSKMEDVIFAGTQLRRPMGFASVTLNIENDKGLLNIDSRQVSVTRKLYRSGESEYLINGAQVRLKDVSELFMDTGLGRDGYSIIGQGRVAEIVSSKSGERRDIFEEAAGISKFRFRKAEAQRRLDKAEENILRLEDIISELEGRVEPLKRQSEKAHKFIELAERRKVLEITSWMSKLSELKSGISELEEKILISTSEYDSAEADISRLEDKQQSAAKDMAAGNMLIDRLKNEILEAERSNAAIHADIAVSKNDIAHCRAALESLDKQLQTASLSEDENRRLTEQKQTEKDNILREIEKAQKSLDLAGEELYAANRSKDGFEKELSEQSGRLNEMYIRRTELTVTVNSEKNNLEETAARTENALKQLEAADAEKQALLKERSELLEALSLLEEKKAEQKNRADGIKRLLTIKQEKLSEEERGINELSLSIREKEQKKKLLCDLESSMEGFGNAVRQVLKAAKAGRISGITGSISQLITAPSEYSTAIETALGAALQNIVTENEDAAKRGIRLLKEMNAGRATFLPVTSVRGSRLAEKGLSDCMGFVALGCDIITYDPRFEGIVNSLLGRTVIAEDIDCAAAIAKRYGYRFRIVTLDGQVVNAGGSFTGGSTNRSSGVLTRKNEIERLSAEISSDNELLSRARQKAAAIKAEADKMKVELEGKLDELVLTDQDKIRFESELKRIFKAIEQNDAAKAAAEAAVSALRKKYEDTENAAKAAREELSLLAAAINEAQKHTVGKNERLERLRTETEELAAKMSDLKVRITALLKDKESAEEGLRMLSEQSRSINSSRAELKAQAEEHERIIAQTLADIERCESSLDGAKERTEEIGREIERTRLDNLEKERISNILREEIREANSRKERFGAERTRLEERKNASLAECDKIVADMAEQYELYPSEAQEIMLKDCDRVRINSELSEVKQKIRLLGTVNLSAIEEYKEVSERYEFMSGQLSDIVSSKKELTRLIDELTETMKKKFSESFEFINRNFKSIFTELFGGGKAELVLTDPQNVLESGIEINVAPPGKVIKSLSLLSGGEQAFVAIAIYFAILKLRPAPFCILDEIEAALDDVNVAKYAHYLRNFTDTTQFIAVTHRRGTMEEADVMYGVTMQEKGISRLLKMEQPPVEDDR